MKVLTLIILASFLISPSAIAEVVISPDSSAWRENYKKGQQSLSAKHYGDAELHFSKARSIAAQNFKSNDSRLFATISELMEVALALKDSSKYEEFRKIQEAAYINAFGPNYAMVGMLEGYNGLTLEKLGKLNEAQEAYKRSIQVMEQSLGSDNPKIAEVCHRCAVLQWEIGEPAEALKMIQKEEGILLKISPVPDCRLGANLSLQTYIYEALSMPKEAQAATSKLLVLQAKSETSEEDNTTEKTK